MKRRQFTLDARVDTDNPTAVRPVLEKLVANGLVKPGATDNEFIVRARFDGESSKTLNRLFLSSLRRAERRTRMRAEWTSTDGTVHRFFDYVLKKTAKA